MSSLIHITPNIYQPYLSISIANPQNVWKYFYKNIQIYKEFIEFIKIFGYF
jgi:hypothetical protein